ncbi:MAG: hypothetical protein CL878_02520 [Dehalococcoidia bacterium]|nr:hypothetical protein [Dehalococcoidia bacterium]
MKEGTPPLVPEHGDIFVLFLPGENEVSTLRQHQQRLQALFGGQLVGPHLTCQRFTLADAERVPDVLAQLQSQLSAVQPFALAATSAMPLYSRFRNVPILKWHVPVTSELRQVEQVVDSVITTAGGTCHYPRFEETRIVTALVDINDGEGDPDLAGLGFPYYLFTTRTAVFSRQIGPRGFETLGRAAFHFESSPALRRWTGRKAARELRRQQRRPC